MAKTVLRSVCAAAFFAAGCTVGRQAAKEAPGFPKAVISNGIVEAAIYLPDPVAGYYRGQRFDWSGLVEEVKYAGHTYFGRWKVQHAPDNHDDVVGPAEEFGMGQFAMPAPLGYQEAKPGEPFVKLGVGVMEKAQPEYWFFGKYKWIRPGEWKVESGPNWVEFRQRLRTEFGWGYDYAKRIVLEKSEPRMTIRHTLRNTGSRPIHNTVYCHNFLMIDGEPVGPSYVLRFPFEVTAKSDLKGLAAVKGKEIVFTREFAPDKDVLFTILGGFGNSVSDNEVTVENTKTGAGVEIAGTLPLLQFCLFCVRTALCPEPFVNIELAPGEKQRWEVSYSFFAVRR